MRAAETTTNGKIAATEIEVATHVPYTRHVDPHTVATRDHYLVQVVQLEGFSWETADQAEINTLTEIRNTLWRGLSDSRFGIYYHVIRRRATHYPEGAFTGFAQQLDEAWRQKFADKNLYANRHYLSVIRRPLTGVVGFGQQLGRLFSAQIDQQEAHRQREADRRALRDAVQLICTTLGRYGARQLGILSGPEGDRSEVLEFLAELINQERRRVLVPSCDLSSYLPTHRTFFGRDAMEVRGATAADTYYGAMLSIREYPPQTGPGMIDSLLRLPRELILTQSFGIIDRQSALGRMQLERRKMDVSEEAALSLRDQLTQAMDDLASGRILLGDHHLSVLVLSRQMEELDQGISDVMGQLNDLGILAVREDINLEPTYWAQLPANFGYASRRAPISSLNFAGFASFHDFPHGRATDNHWGPCVSVLETTSATPYYFSFHHHDLGNFTVLGPSGTGKTVVLTFLMAQAQRFAPRCIFFDKDRGAEIFLRALGGAYSVIRPGHPTGWNPLQLPDTATNRAFLRQWLSQLARPLDGTPLSPTDQAILADAVEANYRSPQNYRRLSYIQELFVGHERQSGESLSARMAQWHGEGERAWLFDDKEDNLDLADHCMGFDLTTILEDPVSRVPAMMYMFHGIDAALDGHRTIIFIDEGWRALDDPAFEDRLKDWLKTLRKRNGLLGFGSQSAQDALRSRIGDSIIEQCPTQLFMPNARADRTAYRKGFGLSEAEYQVVRTLPDTSRCFLLKHGTQSVVARLDLSGHDDLLAVLSGREESVGLLDQIRAEVGDQPEDWLPVFHERRKQ